MPTTRRRGMDVQNATPWVSHRRTIVDVDEIDRQSIAEAKSVRSTSNVLPVDQSRSTRYGTASQTQQNSRTTLQRTRSEKSIIKQSSPRQEIRATAAREFFVGLGNRSTRDPSFQGIEALRTDLALEAEVAQTVDIDTSRPPQQQVPAPPAQRNYGGYTIADGPKLESPKKSSAEGKWVYADPSAEGRIAGLLTWHEGQQGRWLLLSDPGYGSQQNWVFAPEKKPKSKRSRQRRSKKSSKDVVKNQTSFLTLPGELRNNVYAYAIPECRVLIAATKPNKEFAQLKNMWCEESDQHKRKPTKLFHVLDNDDIDQGFELTMALLLTCGVVRNDVEKYLYSRTTFCFDSPKILSRFLNTASKPGLKSIRRVELSHEGYSNPENTKDRIFRERYYAKWLQTCTQFGSELTGLEELKLEAVLRKWPCEFAALNNSNDIWRRACLQLAPRRLNNVQVRLQHPMIKDNRNVLVDLARALENDMMTQEGRNARDKWEHEQVVGEVRARKQAEREAKAKAKRAELLAAKPLKPLIITKEEMEAQKPVPIKALNKGLEKYHRIDIGGMNPEELEYFKHQYCSQKHNIQANC